MLSGSSETKLGTCLCKACILDVSTPHNLICSDVTPKSFPGEAWNSIRKSMALHGAASEIRILSRTGSWWDDLRHGRCHRSVPNLLATKFSLLGTYNLRHATSTASQFNSIEQGGFLHPSSFQGRSQRTTARYPQHDLHFGPPVPQTITLAVQVQR